MGKLGFKTKAVEAEERADSMPVLYKKKRVEVGAELDMEQFADALIGERLKKKANAIVERYLGQLSPDDKEVIAELRDLRRLYKACMPASFNGMRV